jgi:hypothetical protein
VISKALRLVARWLLGLGGALLLLLSLGPLFYHSRSADQAYERWRRQPTAESEAAWIRERDQAVITETQLRAGLFLVGVLGLAGAWVSRRKPGPERPVASTPAPRGRRSREGHPVVAAAVLFFVLFIAGLAAIVVGGRVFR